MNKMKKFLVALTVATLFGTSFVSCIDNEVSDVVDDIYKNYATLLSSQAEVNLADARLADAEAAYKLAMAKGEDAKAAKILAEIKRLEFDLKKAQEDHLVSLRTRGFEVVDALFSKYTYYRGLATNAKERRNSAQATLNTHEKAKIDGVLTLGDLNRALSAQKKNKEILVNEKVELEAALVAAKEDSNVAEKVRLEGILKGYRKDSADVNVKIALKGIEAEEKQDALDMLIGDTNLLSQYTALRTDSITYANYKFDNDSLVRKKGILLTEAKDKLNRYDVILAGLRAVVTAKEVVKGAATTALGTATTALGTATTALGTATEEYNEVKLYTDSKEDSLNVAALDLRDFEANETTNAGYEKDLAAKQVLKDTAQARYNRAKVRFDNDRTGFPKAPGTDGVFGNSTDDTNGNYEVGGVGTTYRQISVVSVNIAGEKTVMFNDVEYFDNVDEYPIKTVATTGVSAVRFGVTTTAYADLSEDDLGKLFNVEADDDVNDRNNAELFTEASSALVDAEVALAAAQKTFDDYDYEAQLAVKQALYNKLADLFENAAERLRVAKAAVTTATSAVTTATSAVTTATSAVTTATAAVTTAQAKVDNFQTKVELQEIIDILPVEIEQLRVDLANNDSKISAKNAEIAVLRAKIATASSSTDEEGARKLTEELLSLRSEISELEITKANLVGLISSYESVILLINLGIEAIERKIETLDVTIEAADMRITVAQKSVDKGVYDGTALVELIALLKGQLADMDAEIAEYLGLASTFKAKAEAALALVTSTATTTS